MHVGVKIGIPVALGAAAGIPLGAAFGHRDIESSGDIALATFGGATAGLSAAAISSPRPPVTPRVGIAGVAIGTAMFAAGITNMVLEDQ